MMGSIAVSEGIYRPFFGNFGLLFCLLHGQLHGTRIVGLGFHLGIKEIDLRFFSPVIFTEQIYKYLWQDDKSVFVAFALIDPNLHTVGVDVFDLYVDGLAEPGACHIHKCQEHLLFECSCRFDDFDYIFFGKDGR